MRIARLLSVLLAVLTVGLLVAPAAPAKPPFRLPSQIVDEAGVLGGAGMNQVSQAVDRLYADHQVRLWVVYVDTFSRGERRAVGAGHPAGQRSGPLRRAARGRHRRRAYAFLAESGRGQPIGGEHAAAQ
jgi:hypothetical protein